jgi:hypothetical protein
MGLSVEQWAAGSSAVVLGTVGDIGDAQWNTKDGMPPTQVPPAYSDVMRLIRIDQMETLKGQLTSSTAWIPGGTIGCLTFVVDEYTPVIGSKYVFFMRDLDPLTGLKGTSRVRLMWPVNDDGTVATQIDGSLSLDEFRALVAGS